jgi:hypothetical protein
MREYEKALSSDECAIAAAKYANDGVTASFRTPTSPLRAHASPVDFQIAAMRARARAKRRSASCDDAAVIPNE